MYWHPLASFPGPRLLAISRLPYAYYHSTGRLAATFHKLHEQYGPAVRTAPNEVSFTDPEALKIIYTETRKGHFVFRKNYDTFNETRNQIAHSVFIADDDDHARMRKIINLAFSERPLRDQEPRIQQHIQSFIEQLERKMCQSNGVVDINEWYNFAAFDVITDMPSAKRLTPSKIRPTALGLT